MSLPHTHMNKTHTHTYTHNIHTLTYTHTNTSLHSTPNTGQPSLHTNTHTNTRTNTHTRPRIHPSITAHTPSPPPTHTHNTIPPSSARHDNTLPTHTYDYSPLNRLSLSILKRWPCLSTCLLIAGLSCPPALANSSPHAVVQFHTHTHTHTDPCGPSDVPHTL